MRACFALRFSLGWRRAHTRAQRRLGAVINEHPIDVAFVGIGENGHLAFNDPPADFDTEVRH
jgi:6-phosphogluconolactonase/glucosamine-6-phosphate isomerase/deaminase